jgi:hypothetical protein
MATTKGVIVKPFVALLLTMPMLMFAAGATQSVHASNKQDEPSQKNSSKPKGSDATKPSDKHEAEKPNEIKHYTLRVVVHTQDGQSLVEGAKVRIHAGDYDEERRTSKEGIVRFEFDTNVKAATVRITADHFATDQQLVALPSVTDVRIVLRKDQ